jgi:uracil-DNA glycosylase
MRARLPADWREVLRAEVECAEFSALEEFLVAERRACEVAPAEEAVFAAFAHTPFDRVRVVLVGQDPYPTPGHAHGLALSVPPGVAPPPSLANMLKELATDVGCRAADNGCLVPWAEQGVLLLNTVLTLRAGESNSHQGKGWERFTDGVIRAVDARAKPAVFVLWGGAARKKAKLVVASRHRVLEGVHPSPLSAHTGFFGSKPFSRINEALVGLGDPPIDWQLPDLGVPAVRMPRSKRSG